MTLDHIISGLLEFSTNEQGSKSVTKALKEGGKETLDKIVKRMAESAKGYEFCIRLYLFIVNSISLGGEELSLLISPYQ